MIDALIPAGKLTNTHGIKGQMKAEVYLDSLSYLKSFKRIVVSGKEYALASVTPAGPAAIVTLDGIDNINKAMELKGRDFYIYREDAGLKDGTFFLQDVIGFTVLDRLGNEVGKVTDVIENPAHPIFVINGQEEHLVPAVNEFIVSTDFDNSAITINMMEGL